MSEHSARSVVVEIRVHGVNGGAPEHMLDDPFPRQIAGDDSARFLRRRTWRTDGPHVLEAFHWGRFTSGSPTRALWLLLAPFGILNLAAFTLLPTGDTADRATRLVRVTIRLLGLLLTVTLVLSVARATMDLIVHQCAAAQACRDANGWLGPLGGWSDGARFLVGVTPPGLVILALWWFGRQTFLYDPPGRPADTHFTDTLGDRGFWHTERWVMPLRSAHVMAACAVLGGLCLLYLDAERQGQMAIPDVTLIPIAVVLGAAGLAAVVIVTKPGRFVDAHPTATWGARLAVARRVSLLALLAAAGVAAASTSGATPSGPRDGVPMARMPLPGFETATLASLALLSVLLLVLVLGCAWLRVRWAEPENVPPSFRPLWGGFAPAVLAALAMTLAGGFSGGLIFWVANLLGEVTLAVTAVPAGAQEWPILLGGSYFTIGRVAGGLVLVLVAVVPALAAALLRTGRATAWLLLAAGAAGAAVMAPNAVGMAFAVPQDLRIWLVGTAAVLAAAGALTWRQAWARERIRALVEADYAAPAPPPGRGARETLPTAKPDTAGAVALNWRLARSKYRYHWVLGTVGVLGAVGAALAAVLRLGPPPDAEVSPAGPLLLSAIALGFLTLGLRTWTSPGLRVTVGILWDLVAFWPRSAHPLCPPPYGGRAVLELARRTADIATDSREEAGEGVYRVVLSGHSQGSLVCLAAVSVIIRESECDDQHEGEEFMLRRTATATLPKVSLVTYGSQLQWAYARLFPRYVSRGILCHTFTTLDGRWRNLHRWTDPLGGPVLAWPVDGAPEPSGLGERAGRWASVTGNVGSPRPPLDGQARGDRIGRVGPDTRLPDPVRLTTSPHTVRAPLLGHGDYFADEVAYAAAVREVIAAPAPPAPPGSPEPTEEGPAGDRVVSPSL